MSDTTESASSHTENQPAVAGGEISVLDIAIVIMRHVRVVIALTIIVPAGMVGLELLFGGEYQADSRFLPQSTEANAVSQYAGLAAQFGVALPNMGGESVAFYGNLVTSRDLLGALATTEFEFPSDREGGEILRGNLLQLYKIEGDTPAEAKAELVEQLREELVVRTDAEAGTVEILTVAPWALLAEAMNARILELIQEFNVEQRQSQARAQREFVESRLAEAQDLLRRAENDLQEFMEGNRTYDSPQLAFQFGRLQRRVDLRQQLYLTLSQALEQAKIDEVRDLPVITVISSPKGSADRKRGLLMKVIVGAILGGGLAVLYAFGIEFVLQQRSINPDKVNELGRLGRSALPRNHS